MGQSDSTRRSILERGAITSAIASTLNAARSGRGAVLFLVGEAGLGKTTMLGHGRAIAEHDFAVGSGRGDAAEAALPFGIISQALDDFGSGGAFAAGGTPLVSGMDARAAHFYAVLQFLESKSTHPLALLLDDLHWADPDTIDLLAFLSRRIEPLPIAIIGTLRPWPPGALAVAERLASGGDARLERLEPLSEAGTVALLEEQVGHSLSRDLIKTAPALTSGNPLLLEQLGQLVARSISLPEAGTQPRTFEAGVLRARFAGGTPAELRYADAACIFGTNFQPSFAAELAGLSGPEADQALEGLCGSGVIRTGSDGLAEFAHPLLRQTLYDHIPPPLRARKHAAAFRILLAHGTDAAGAAEHAIRGDLVGDREAVAVLEHAGQEARAAGALTMARERFEAAVRLAGSRATTRLLVALTEVLLSLGDAEAAERVCRRLLDMGELAEADRVAVRRLFGRALFIGGDAQAAQREFQAAVDDAAGSAPSDAVQTLLEAVYVSWPTAGPALATPLALRARARARDIPEELRLRAETAWAFCAFVGGNPLGVGAIEEAARRAEADPMSDIGAFAWTWGSLGLYGNVTKWMERFDDAERAFKVGMETAERLNLPVAIASLAVMHGDTCARTGRLQEGLRWLDRASGLAELAPERAFWAAVAHAYILTEMGRADEARSWAQTARLLADPSDSWPGWLWLWHVDAQLAQQERRREDACALFERIEVLADKSGILEPCIVPWMGDAMQAYSASGRFDDASRILERLESSVRELPCRIPRVVLALAHARRADLLGQPEEAETAYREALDLARPIGAPALMARALLAYGLYLRKHDALVRARAPFAEAMELAESAGCEPLATRAAAELKMVGGRRRRRDESPDALSPAEERVASLAGEGWSDREIAVRLNLSIHTVETHLQHIYRKRGIKSRRELMRRAASRAGLGD